MSAVEIKICGIVRVEDALAAIESGTAMLGLNFYERSPRCIALQRAQEIAEAVAGRAKLVGVFVNMNVSDVLRIARAVPLDAVQLHGDESRQECEAIAAEFEVIRALKVGAEFSAGRVSEFACCRGLLLDTPSAAHGGSGKSFDWASVQWESVRGALREAKMFLAGGLHAGNVSEAIAIARPAVVDVCSGVEAAKGIKSAVRMHEFVAAVRAAERYGL
ncbi:MAG: N-(5'-phosphoribosyl)anthranilate isomerase [Acidobacteria bacterium]|nr:MAG: N-(5'-phosphoribosyl)anthranilate isomerase [Acidobacteriota bacterium]